LTLGSRTHAGNFRGGGGIFGADDIKNCCHNHQHKHVSGFHFKPPLFCPELAAIEKKQVAAAKKSDQDVSKGASF
jgi:hypothetical protein